MTSTAADVAAFVDARRRVLETIAEACRRAGRDPADVLLVAVSKTVEPPRVQAAVDAGLDVLGENRVQEAQAKAAIVSGARWHLVGPLQSNKARRAVELFDAVETVDSVDIARRLDRLAGELGRVPLGIYVQVNVDRDPAKAGFAPDRLEAALGELAGLANLRLLGLMTVGRLAEGPENSRPTFVALRELSEHVRRSQPALDRGLSMGMTDDYAIAVEEGATVVRVGRAIFGERPK